MSLVDEAKLAEIAMLVPAHARSLAERLGLKRLKAPLKPLAVRLLALGMAAAQVR